LAKPWSANWGQVLQLAAATCGALIAIMVWLSIKPADLTPLAYYLLPAVALIVWTIIVWTIAKRGAPQNPGAPAYSAGLVYVLAALVAGGRSIEIIEEIDLWD
jgi:hypothetical protein